MRFGYWMPIFGGWLRNVTDEGMPVSWPYIRDLAAESEQLGFDLSLIAELNLNDIKGHRAPSLDCWTLAPAIAARCAIATWWRLRSTFIQSRRASHSWT